MKRILTIYALLFILLFAVIGCLYIFDVMTPEAATSAMLKFGAAILLLGVCTAAVKLLMSNKSESAD